MGYGRTEVDLFAEVSSIVREYQEFLDKTNHTSHVISLKELCDEWNRTKSRQLEFYVRCSTGQPLLGLAMMGFWAVLIYMTMMSANRFRLKFLFYSNAGKIVGCGRSVYHKDKVIENLDFV